MHIHSLLFGASGLAEITGEVADPCITRKKTPLQRVPCFNALSSGLTGPKTPNAAADHQFVGAQLYTRVAL